MDNLQYEQLRIFPSDKSYLSHERLDELTDKDYGWLVDNYGELYKLGYLKGGLPEPGFAITDFGIRERKRYKRKLYLDHFAYLRAKLWWLIAILGYLSGIFSPDIVREKLIQAFQSKTKAKTKVVSELRIGTKASISFYK